MPSIIPQKATSRRKAAMEGIGASVRSMQREFKLPGTPHPVLFSLVPVRLACASPQSSPASSGHKNARCMYVPISKTQFDGGCGGSSVPRPTVPKLVLLHLTESDRTAPAILVSRPTVPASHPLHVRLPRLETKGNGLIGKLSIYSMSDSRNN